MSCSTPVPAIANTPYFLRAIIADQQGSIRRHHHTHWSSPHTIIVGISEPTGHQILILIPDDLSIQKPNSDNLITRQLLPIPRATERHEGVALILLWEHLSIIEGNSQRCRVRSEEDVWNKLRRLKFTYDP